jgi:O-antigen ligase
MSPSHQITKLRSLKDHRVSLYWYLFALLVLALGLFSIVYSWPIFLLILLTILAIVLAWRHLPGMLIILPALIPFLPALNPTADIDLASSRLAIVFLVGIGYLYIVYTKKPWFSLSTPTILILFFLAWSLFSGVMADDPGRFIRKYLVFLTIFPIYFLMVAFLRYREQWLKLFKYWSWSAFFVSLLGLGQFLAQFVIGRETLVDYWGKYVAPILFGANAGSAVASNPSWLVNISGATVLRSFGTFPDPHMLAFFLGMSLPLQVAYAMEKKNKWLWFLPVVSFWVLLLTFSRGSYVGLAGVAVWMVVYLLKQGKITGRTVYRAILGIILAVMLLFSIAPVRDRFTSIFDLSEGSNRGRLITWSDAIEVIKYNPVLGVGLGNYANFVRPEAKYREPIYAHNAYLDVSSEIGIPGAIAWILLLLWAIKPLFSNRSGPRYNLAAALGLLWFSSHSFFETPLFSPQILPLILVLIGYRVSSEQADFKT